MINAGLFSSRSDEWETPDDLFSEINKCFGPFTLDPCASHKNHKCEKYFTETEDGLEQSWRGHRVFMNPPYGRALRFWIKKAYEESRYGDTEVVALMPARTDTEVWHKYVMNAMNIYLVKGRVYFVPVEGKSAPAPFPSAIIHWTGESLGYPMVFPFEYKRVPRKGDYGKPTYVDWSEYEESEKEE